MSTWMTIWTILLVCGVGIFAVMAVMAAIGGADDIRQLFRKMDEGPEEEEEQGGSERDEG